MPKIFAAFSRLPFVLANVSVMACNFGTDLRGGFFDKILNKFVYIFCSVTQESLNNLVELYEDWGKPEKAEE